MNGQTLTTSGDSSSSEITVKWDSIQWATQAQNIISTGESLQVLDIGNLSIPQLDLLVKLFRIYGIFSNFKLTPNHLIGTSTNADLNLATRLRDMVAHP